jgi:hypothetical protein
VDGGVYGFNNYYGDCLDIPYQTHLSLDDLERVVALKCSFVESIGSGFKARTRRKTRRCKRALSDYNLLMNDIKLPRNQIEIAAWLAHFAKTGEFPTPLGNFPSQDAAGDGADAPSRVPSVVRMTAQSGALVS